MSSPTPGPSLASAGSYFPTPFRLTDYKPGQPSSSSRHSSPSSLPPRFRSSSVFSSSPFHAEERRNQRLRYESVLRLKSSWDLLVEKYGDIRPEEDDEIDLRTGRIVKDRGKIRQLETREFGNFSESEEEEEVSFLFDQDEDEIGAWDNRSGLEQQVFTTEEINPQPVRPIWTEEDDEDLRAFMRAEAERRRVMGDESESDDARRRSASVSSVGSSNRTPSPRGWQHELNAISPRDRGTRIVGLEDLFSEEDADGESSEDELVAPDSDLDEATRTSPVRSSDVFHSTSPEPRRSGKLEVLIPIRSSSHKPSRRRHTSSSSSSSPPLPTSKSHTALDDLFTPPPAAHSRTTQSVPPKPTHSTIIRSQTVPTPITYQSKGKQRMSGERPLSLDPNRYCANLYHTANGVTLHFCRACRDDGGERERFAEWCKGRRGVWLCTFEKDKTAQRCAAAKAQRLAAPKPIQRVAAANIVQRDAPTTESEFEPPSGKDDSETDDLESLTEYTPAPSSKRGRTASTPRTPQNDADFRSDLDPAKYYLTLHRRKEAPDSIFKCRACRLAGGKRGDLSGYCKGRVAWQRCTFEMGKGHILAPKFRAKSKTPAPQGSNETPIPQRKPPRPVQKVKPGPYFSRPRIMRDGTTPAQCKACRKAGGERQEKAYLCKGRNGRKFCLFLKPQPPGRGKGRNDKVVPASEQDTDVNDLDVEAVPQVEDSNTESDAQPTVRSARGGRHRRIMSTSATSEEPVTRSSSRPSRISLPPSSPPFAPSPSPIELPRTVSPSSPPITDLPFPNAKRHQSTFHPTPSPSLSAPHRDAVSVEPVTSTSPLFGVRSFRFATMAARPTPASSSLSARSLSVSSDHRPLTLPRKSALRRPSEFGSVPPGGAKRARFALEIRSPPREPSSDPVAQNEEDSDDELLIGTSSPAIPFANSTNFRYRSNTSTSSSPLQSQLEVRAADVGLDLGPEPDGRVSSGLLAALGPSLETARPTLGSSLFPLPSKTYILPTPPPSFGSSSSRATASPTRKFTPGMGLMLPPPVPPNRLSSARQETPISITNDTETNAGPGNGSGNGNGNRESSIGITTRARSRSTSVIPRRSSLTPAPSTIRYPSTTPRRKSRIERDLARVAQSTGDDAGLEWGMDEEVGVELGREWREGSVFKYVD